MNYDWIKYEEIEKAVYPNLLAEIKESGYSTSTLADFMGLGAKKNGKYRPEGDPEVWDKLTGKKEMFASEFFGLAKYYNVEANYLISHKLSVVCGKSQAYWRWYDDNHKRKSELQRNKTIKQIYDVLVAEPHTLEFIKMVVNMTQQQREQVLQMLKEGAV